MHSIKRSSIDKAVETVHDRMKIELLETNILKMGKPDAASEIADEVLKLADAYIEKKIRR